MIILSIRTDKPEAELGLFDDSTKIADMTWPAHRELANTIHNKISSILSDNQRSLSDVDGFVVYEGPGSFTGLRIGLTVANTFADALSIPIVGSTESTWQQDGIKRLANGENDIVAMPEYGAPPKTTSPKH